jgi:ADP-heptose:LPS heptosyltransferase
LPKILIIRFSSIGDIVLTTPVMRCLKIQQPGIEIHYLTKSVFEPLLLANPYIDKIYSIKNNVSEVLAGLKKENYDHVVDLHKNFRSVQTLLALRKPFSTFTKLNIRKWLYVHMKINILPEIHISERYMQAVSKYGVTYDRKGLDYFIPGDMEVELSSLPAEQQKGYVIIALGGLHNTKQIPDDLITEVCRILAKPVILTGSKEDEKRALSIIQKTGDICFNACGKFSINQAASLIRQSLAIITADTGLMHIAAALKKPVISVWGNTVPEFGMYPLFPAGFENLSQIMEIKGLTCRPCSKLGKKQCPKGHFNCMNKIRPAEIVEKAISLIGK